MDKIQEVRQLAALAGIRLTGQREAVFAAGFEGMRRMAEALSRRDYGEGEPASYFRPPGRTRE